MARSKKAFRTLAIDTLLSCPGIAVIDVSHVKTKSIEPIPIALRTQIIEECALLFIRKHAPYDLIIREGFASKIPHTNYTVFSAWNAVDRALNSFGLKVDDSIGQGFR